MMRLLFRRNDNSITVISTKGRNHIKGALLLMRFLLCRNDNAMIVILSTAKNHIKRGTEIIQFLHCRNDKKREYYAWLQRK